VSADIFATGRLFARRNRLNDSGDVVRLVGVMPKFAGTEFLGDRLVVESAGGPYGATPAAWDSHRVLFPVDDFTEEYTEMTGAERATLAAEQVIAAKEATAANADRVSPWAYAVPAARRTSKGARS
jgi:hypothetical protein